MSFRERVTSTESLRAVAGAEKERLTLEWAATAVNAARLRPTTALPRSRRVVLTSLPLQSGELAPERSASVRSATFPVSGRRRVRNLEWSTHRRFPVTTGCQCYGREGTGWTKGVSLRDEAARIPCIPSPASTVPTPTGDNPHPLPSRPHSNCRPRDAPPDRCTLARSPSRNMAPRMARRRDPTRATRSGL